MVIESPLLRYLCLICTSSSKQCRRKYEFGLLRNFRHSCLYSGNAPSSRISLDFSSAISSNPREKQNQCKQLLYSDEEVQCRTRVERWTDNLCFYDQFASNQFSSILAPQGNMLPLITVVCCFYYT